MSQLHIHTSELKEAIPQLRAGDRLLLSGTVVKLVKEYFATEHPEKLSD